MGAMVNDAVVGGVTLHQCSSASYSGGVEVQPGFSSGGVRPDALFVTKAEPVASWTTTDLGTLLDGIDISTGLCISSGSILVQYRAQACAGDAGSGHLILSGTKGYATIQSVTARQGETASAQVECCFLSTDGFTAPAAASGSLSTASFVGEYTFGGVSINSTTLTGVTGFTVSPNVKYMKRYIDGGVYPTHTFLDVQNPTVDITFEGQAAASAYGPLFLEMTNAAFYLTLREEGGTLSETQATISFGAGIITVEQVSAQGRTPAEVTVRLHGLQLAASV